MRKIQQKVRNLWLIVGMLVALCYGAGLDTVTVSAAETSWSDVEVDIDWDGEGTSSDPKKISSAAELAGLARQVNSGTNYQYVYFALTADIDVNDHNWIPIGTEANKFAGYFDGGYHKVAFHISNTDTTATGMGLFGVIDKTDISNLGTTGTIETASQNTGGIVGIASTYVEFTNCWSTVTIDYTTGGEAKAGGILGYAGNNMDIENCYFTGMIKSSCEDNSKSLSAVCGLIGYSDSYSFTAKNCFVAGTFGEEGLTITEGENMLMGRPALYSNIFSKCYYLNKVYKESTQGTQFTSEMLANGKLAYLLGDGFGQTLSGESKDYQPVLRNGDLTKKVYKVSYKSGDTVIAEHYVNQGSITLPATAELPLDAGYQVLGWYQGEGTTMIDVGTQVTITADVVYNAELVKKVNGWKAITYYSGNNHVEEIANLQLLTSLSLEEYYPGSTAELPTPVIEGLRFLGWYTDADFSGLKLQSVSGQVDPLTLYAKFESLDIWDGTTKDTDWSGKGTSDAPYLITIPEELAGLADLVNQGNTYSNTYFKVTKDLNIGDTWTPIGTETSAFCGSFDGDLHTININIITDSTLKGRALFGYLGDGAQIRNLGTTGSITSASEGSGGIAGYAQSGTVEITDCWSDMLIQPSVSMSGAYYGGILGGKMATVNMTNCYFMGTLGNKDCILSGVGGLCGGSGYVSTGTLNASNCYVTGTYGSAVSSSENLSYHEGNLTNCYYLNKVNSSTQGTQVTLNDVESGKLAWLLNSNQDGSPCNASLQSSWAQGAFPGYVEGSGKPASIPVKSNGTNGVFRLRSVDGTAVNITYSVGGSAITLPSPGTKSWWYQTTVDSEVTYVKVDTSSVSEDSQIYLLGELTSDMVAVTDTYYTGAQAEGNVKVTFGSVELILGTDYTLSYENATDVAESTAQNPPTMTVKGTGSYIGSITKTFTIQEALPICPASYYGVQKRTNATSGTKDIRLIAIIKTLEAEEVGFVYSESDTTPTIEESACEKRSSNQAYSKITVSGTEKTAVQLGGEGAYIIVGTVTEISQFTSGTLYVRVFVVNSEGTTYSDVKALTLSSLQ